jgi:hypothetical protein
LTYAPPHNARTLAAAGRTLLLAAVLLAPALHAQAPRPLLVAYERVPLLDDGSGDLDLFVQALSGDGALMWGQSGVVIANTPEVECRPALIPDGKGGALVLFEVRTVTGEHPGSSDLLAQRVDGAGHLLWNAGAPVALATTEHDERDLHAVSDGAGGALAAFVVEVTGGEQTTSGVCAQRIGPEGGLLWGGGSHAVVIEEATGTCGDLQAVSDGLGGLIVAYGWRPADAAPGAPEEVRCARVAPDGAVLWRTARRGTDAPQFPSPHSPRLAADGSRSVWLAYLYASAARPGIAAERILADGSRPAGPAVVVPPGGKVLWDALSADPCIAADSAGGLVCAYGWRTAEGVRKLAACRLAADGGLLWGAPQLRSVLGDGLATFAAATLGVSREGAATLLAGVPLPGRGYAHALVAQRLSSEGIPTWGAIPIVECGLDGPVRSVQTLPDGLGGIWVLVSHDVRLRGGGLIALRLGSDGRPVWPQALAPGVAPWAGPRFCICAG